MQIGMLFFKQKHPVVQLPDQKTIQKTEKSKT